MGENDIIDIIPGQSGVVHGCLRRRDRQVTAGLVAVGVAPGDDAGTLADPLVAGVHHPGQPVIVHHIVGDVHPRALDHRSHSELLLAGV